MKVRASLRLRNELLLKARESLGFSQPEMAKAIGVPQSVYMDFEKFRFSKVVPGSARWKHAEAVAGFIDADFSDIVPPELAGKDLLSDVSRVLDVAPGGLLGMGRSARAISMDPADILSGKEDREWLESAIRSLPFRQREVIKARRGLLGEEEGSLEEVGRVFKLSRERVRQIEMDAVRSLERQATREKHK